MDAQARTADVARRVAKFANNKANNHVSGARFIDRSTLT